MFNKTSLMNNLSTTTYKEIELAKSTTMRRSRSKAVIHPEKRSEQSEYNTYSVTLETTSVLLCVFYVKKILVYMYINI